MNGSEIFVWLVIGVIPYHITWRHEKKGRTVNVQACLWSLESFLGPSGQSQYILDLPFVKQLGRAARAFFSHL